LEPGQLTCSHVNSSTVIKMPALNYSIAHHICQLYSYCTTNGWLD